MAKTLAQGRKPGSGRKPGKGKTLREGRKPGSGRRRRQDIGGRDADASQQDQESRPISSRDMEAVDALRELTHSPSSHPAHNPTTAPPHVAAAAPLPPSMDYSQQSLMDQQYQYQYQQQQQQQQQRVDVVPPKPFITHKILLSSTGQPAGQMNSNPNANHNHNHNSNSGNVNMNMNMNFNINGNNQDSLSSFLMGPYNYLQRPFIVKPYLDLSASTAPPNQAQPQPQATHITKSTETTEKNTTI
ncbi:Oligo(A)/oligo(T)-binding protein [Saccharomyces pastorianus]|uniref:Oligo(A)/oligo(T)-binding protein n=1 Tax=Saccharomyces pastorianus TaxID=27292 RepID=A0A6C1EDW8_SACPS|nr:Oligo(A)/oligo(T)-binding protein [Saccharomyces pastorianus]